MGAGAGGGGPLTAGTPVRVFYRHTQNPEGYMPVVAMSAGTLTPRLGQSAGWQRGVVAQDYDPAKASHVVVRYSHTHWVDRDGDRIDASKPQNLEERVLPSIVQRETREEAAAPLPVPHVSFLVVRWAEGNGACGEFVGEAGGWGDTGAVVSDRYVNAIFDHVHRALGFNYAVHTAYVASSEDLIRLGSLAPLLPTLMRPAGHLAACYFLWPVAFRDGNVHMPAGYVEKRPLLDAMCALESAGVPSRFPHPSSLYDVFLTKDWTSQLCLCPELRLPITIKVARQSVQLDPRAAAEQALKTLVELAAKRRKAQRRHARGGRRAEERRLPGLPSGAETTGPWEATRGVVKLGNSWEAADVVTFDGVADCAEGLQRLVEQPQCLSESLFVQERVEDATCEIRTFMIEGEPVHQMYTRFLPAGEDGKFRNFERNGRDRALEDWFGGNERALAHAERVTKRLAKRYLVWLKTQCPETPPVFRVDCFVRMNGDRCDVFAGELTEMGCSTLGWPDGPSTIFPAFLRCCFQSGPACTVSGCTCRALHVIHERIGKKRAFTGAAGGEEKRLKADDQPGHPTAS